MAVSYLDAVGDKVLKKGIISIVTQIMLTHAI